MKNGIRYICDASGDPVACDDFESWTNWFHHADRQLALHTVEGVRVSTVFMGIDQGLGTTSSPLLWETLVAQANWGKIYARRYASKHAAVKGHGQVVELLKKERLQPLKEHLQASLAGWAKAPGA